MGEVNAVWMQCVDITERPTQLSIGEVNFLHARNRQAFNAAPSFATVSGSHDQTA